MRIEDKCVDNGVSFARLLSGFTYRSTATKKLFIAGVDSENKRTITSLENGQVWYQVADVTRFTVVEAHVCVTKG